MSNLLQRGGSKPPFCDYATDADLIKCVGHVFTWI